MVEVIALVEYETIGIIIAVIGLVSYQIKLTKDTLKEKIEDAVKQGNQEHKRLDKKIDKIADHIGCIE